MRTISDSWDPWEVTLNGFGIPPMPVDSRGLRNLGVSEISGVLGIPECPESPQISVDPPRWSRRCLRFRSCSIDTSWILPLWDSRVLDDRPVFQNRRYWFTISRLFAFYTQTVCICSYSQMRVNSAIDISSLVDHRVRFREFNANDTGSLVIVGVRRFHFGFISV